MAASIRMIVAVKTRQVRLRWPGTIWFVTFFTGTVIFVLNNGELIIEARYKYYKN
jgi:uncharacterized membrane protein YozB (DUF420 family)